MQSLDRIHRIGLDPKKYVHYYILKAKGSIDDVIDKRLTEKMARLLKLLNDDFKVLDLDSSMEDIADESEEEADFNAMIKYLRIQANK
jgi:SNF2 family DNA or RNA helicase